MRFWLRTYSSVFVVSIESKNDCPVGINMEADGSVSNLQMRLAHHHPGYEDEHETMLFTLPTYSMNNNG